MEISFDRHGAQQEEDPSMVPETPSGKAALAPGSSGESTRATTALSQSNGGASFTLPVMRAALKMPLRKVHSINSKAGQKWKQEAELAVLNAQNLVAQASDEDSDQAEAILQAAKANLDAGTPPTIQIKGDRIRDHDIRDTSTPGDFMQLNSSIMRIFAEILLRLTASVGSLIFAGDTFTPQAMPAVYYIVPSSWDEYHKIIGQSKTFCVLDCINLLCPVSVDAGDDDQTPEEEVVVDVVEKENPLPDAPPQELTTSVGAPVGVAPQEEQI